MIAAYALPHPSSDGDPALFSDPFSYAITDVRIRTMPIARALILDPHNVIVTVDWS